MNHVGMDTPQTDPQLRQLFHQLNNQLGIVLAHAELLEAKAADSANRSRAEQVVRSVLDAMGTAKEIRRHSESQAFKSRLGTQGE
jgi:GAF domain-containing protein